MKQANKFNGVFKPGIVCLSMAMALFGISLSSCSDDDDNDGGGKKDPVNLETPAYEDVSAKYEITSGGNGITSIELTASGDYIITMGQGTYAQASADAAIYNSRAKSLLGGNTKATRAGSGNIHGKFVKISSTEFILEGYGSIVIEGAADNAFSIQVTPSEGATFTLNATKAETMADSEMTNALCRTWEINTVRIVGTFNGSNFYDSGNVSASEYNGLYAKLNKAMQELSERVNGEPDNEEYFPAPGYNPENIIFTKAGTYLVTADTQQLGVSIWQWTNEAGGVLRYSHNIDNILDTSYSNEASITFDGSSMTMSEVNLEDSEEGFSLRVMSYYGCTEAK